MSQWTITSSGTGVSFLVGVPEANADYLVKANGEKFNYYKSTSAKEINFSYTSDLTSKAFEVIRENQPIGTGFPSVAFQAPAPPKQGFIVSINNGAKKTTQREVTLTLNGGSDARKMSLSESKDFKDATQETYTTSRNWTLSEGDGVKTVYVKFFTQYGQPSEALSDSIVLETSLPQQIQEEPETEKTVKEELITTPPAHEKQNAKIVQQRTSPKFITPSKIYQSSTNITPSPKSAIVPDKPKALFDETSTNSIGVNENTLENEITSSIAPQIVLEEKPVLPEKKMNRLKLKKALSNMFGTA